VGTEVDLIAFSSTIGSLINDLKSDMYSQVNDLERYLHSATVYGDMPANFLAAVTDISFDGIASATDILESAVLELVPTRDLMPNTEEMETGHTFISPQLDLMEDRLIALLNSSGTDTIKDISSAFLSDQDIAAIESAYYEYRQASLNMKTAILNRYATPDMQGNIDWIEIREQFALTDFQKELYSQLFEIAQSTTSWISKQAVAIEQMHADFTSSYNSLLNKLVAANVAAYKAEAEANISNLKNQIIKQDALVDINKMKADQKITEVDLKVKQEMARLSAYTQHYAQAMSSTLENLDINVGVSKAVAVAYKSILAAHSQRYSGITIGRQ